MDKKDSGREVKVGAIIKCRTLDNKQRLNEELINKKFETHYHFPSKIMPLIRRICDDFKKISNVGFDPTTAHLLIRPNKNCSGLVLKYRTSKDRKWSHIGSTGILTGSADDNGNEEHVDLFKNLEKQDISD